MTRKDLSKMTNHSDYEIYCYGEKYRRNVYEDSNGKCYCWLCGEARELERGGSYYFVID